MAKANNQKILAEGMFVEQGMTCRAIAEMIGISENTLSKWRTQGSWDTKRDELLAAPHKIKELLLKELKALANGETSVIDADALAKVSKVIDTLDNKVSIQTVLSVFKEFDNWMSDQVPEIAILFTKWHKSYLQYKIQVNE